MADSDRATCKRCDAPIAPDEPVGLCPRCLLSDTQGGQSERSPIPTRSAERGR